MSTDSDSKLTKHISAVTVMTAEFANSIYGGEYLGEVDDYRPHISGHIHDGTHADGHASKVNISGPTDECHVRGQLRHVNLGGYNGSSPAVQVTNIQSYTQDEIDAAVASGGDNPCVPEYFEVGSEKHYYLDLSMAAGGDDASIQFNKDGAFGGDPGFVYDYNNEKAGIGTANPSRKLHVFDNSGSSPIRVEGLVSSAVSDVVVVDSNGDLFYNSTLTNQDLFETVSTSSAGGGTSNGASCVASSTADTLTIDAGTGVEVNANSGTDTIELSLNASTNDLNDVDTTGPVSNGDVLTYDSVASKWKQLPPAIAPVPLGLATQWVGAESWAPSKIFYNSGNVETYIATGLRSVGMKALRDNNAGDSEFYTTIPIPLSQSLGPPGTMLGSHNVPPGPDDVSGFPTSAARACRVVLYFVMDVSGVAVEPKFNVSLNHNAIATGGDMFPYSDAALVTGAMWNPDHPTAATPVRSNQHIYNLTNGSYYAISDFSSKSIIIDPNNCGIFQINIRVGGISDLSGQGAFTTDELYFVGARLQWTW